jgi:hypothetical protein
MNSLPQSVLSSSFLSQLVSEKLNNGNFLTWKRQIIPFIRSQDLSGHLDGSIPVPPEFLSQEERDSKGEATTVYVRNPEFVAWMKRDQALVAYITSTLSQEVLVAIPDDCTAMQLWNRLVQTFTGFSGQDYVS